MRPEDILNAYNQVTPDQETKDRLLEQILAEACLSEEPISSNPKKAAKRRWFLPAVGAAAALFCLVALPREAPPEAEERPQRPMVQSARPPLASAPAPEQILYNGEAYILRPEPLETEPGELLEELENGALHLLPGENPEEAIALVRDGGVYRCQRINQENYN